MSEHTTPRVALVTGAGRRIGRAIAFGLAQAGWDLALHYRESADEVDALAGRHELGADGPANHHRFPTTSHDSPSSAEYRSRSPEGTRAGLGRPGARPALMPRPSS